MIRSLAVVSALTLAFATGCGGSGTTKAGSSPSPTGVSAGEAKARQFVACARQHGMPSLGDPTVDAQGNVRLPIPPGTAISRQVTEACKQYMQSLGGGGGRTQAQKDAFVQLSACARKNGLPNFPDPNLSGSGPVYPPHAVDTTNPQVEKAYQACRSVADQAGVK